jgi:hypothetical protein
VVVVFALALGFSLCVNGSALFLLLTFPPGQGV